MTLFMTAALDADRERLRDARAIAARYGLTWLPRRRMSIRALMREAGAGLLFVYGQNGLALYDSGGTVYRYHPGTAVVRIKRLMNGNTDLMVEFARLRPGDRVFDATAGMAHDALVAAFVVGPEGEVMAVEKSRVLYILVDHGLKTFDGVDGAVRAAMRRIRLVHGDHAELLPKTPPGSFDVVFFDPMFRRPVGRAVDATPEIHHFGDRAPLSDAAFDAACRVARRAVIVKERPGSDVFRRFGLEVHPRRASFTYGRLDATRVRGGRTVLKEDRR
ncbi:MAG: class I SAM-dependent methyltransferase [Hydrogenibacillus sp.]|nr:class I SAM-dependent methyltransferase [Hydrogenibacillus sp.]